MFKTLPLRVLPICHALKRFARFQSTSKSITVDAESYPSDEWTNIPPFILDLITRKLHKNHNHPIGILHDLIKSEMSGMGYTIYDDFHPIVTKYQNFDSLGFPEDHVGRSKSDTYYFNKNHLLRTHTSAHEQECFINSKTPGYLITADVYRRDEVDRTHYPAFHQMEGARIWPRGDLEQIKKDIEAIPKTNIIVEDPFRDQPVTENNPAQEHMTLEEIKLVSTHLKKTVEYVVNQVFEKARESAKLAGSTEQYLNEPLRVRWVEAYFPWTGPSWEIEVWWKGDWLECCGCGVVQQQVLLNSNLGDDKLSWAFGIGLDRIAMLLFGIPDIRLFWTQDERFHKQFQQGRINTFVPYSRYPGVKRDVSFWLNNDVKLHCNDLMEIVRTHAGDTAESVV
ncbi:phenylalanine--tRNA ligase, partial [Acetobacter pasteurianus]|nr:phenylalanine--tRNA ligase [Acetobacter pasteurianus]